MNLLKKQNNFDLSGIAHLRDTINPDAFFKGSFSTSLDFQHVDTPYFKNKVHLTTNPLAERSKIIEIKQNGLKNNTELDYIYDNIFPELLSFKTQHNSDLDNLYKDLEFLPSGNNNQDDLVFEKKTER